MQHTCLPNKHLIFSTDLCAGRLRLVGVSPPCQGTVKPVSCVLGSRVQAEDLLLLRYIYFAGAGVWLPLGSPTLPWSDPAALPPASGCVSGSSSSSSSSSPDGPHITVAVEPCVLAVGCANNTCSCCRTAALEPQSGWSGAGFPSSGGVGYPASSVRAGLPGSGGTGVGVEGGPSCPDSGCYCVRELQVTVQYTVPQCEVAWDRGFVMAVQGEGREEGKDEEQQEQAEAKEELILQAHVYCSACAFGFPHRGGAAEGELGAGADAALGCAEAQEDDPQDLCGCKHWEVRGGPWVSVSAQPADAVPHPWATGPGGAVAPGAAASAPLAWGQPVVRQAVGMVQVGMAPLAAPQPPPWRSQTLTASAGPGASMPPRGAEPRGFAALLVVEAWRHGRLCGVGHALLLPSNGLLPPPPAHQTTGFATPIAMGVDQAPGPQTPQQPQQALQQARPSAPGPAWLQEAVAIAHTLTLSPATQQCIESSTAAAPAVAAAAQAAAGPRVSVVSGKQGYISARVAVRRPSYRRTALTRLRSWGSGGSGSSSFADQSPRECSPGLLQLRAQQAAAQRGEDPRDLFLQVGGAPREPPWFGCCACKMALRGVLSEACLGRVCLFAFSSTVRSVVRHPPEQQCAGTLKCWTDGCDSTSCAPPAARATGPGLVPGVRPGPSHGRPVARLLQPGAPQPPCSTQGAGAGGLPYPGRGCGGGGGGAGA